MSLDSAGPLNAEYTYAINVVQDGADWLYTSGSISYVDIPNMAFP